jgi:hypothetical protein
MQNVDQRLYHGREESEAVHLCVLIEQAVGNDRNLLGPFVFHQDQLESRSHRLAAICV